MSGTGGKRSGGIDRKVVASGDYVVSETSTFGPIVVCGVGSAASGCDEGSARGTRRMRRRPMQAVERYRHASRGAASIGPISARTCPGRARQRGDGGPSAQTILPRA
jgi:hypothetical protein